MWVAPTEERKHADAGKGTRLEASAPGQGGRALLGVLPSRVARVWNLPPRARPVRLGHSAPAPQPPEQRSPPPGRPQSAGCRQGSADIARADLLAAVVVLVQLVVRPRLGMLLARRLRLRPFGRILLAVDRAAARRIGRQVAEAGRLQMSIAAQTNSARLDLVTRTNPGATLELVLQIVLRRADRPELQVVCEWKQTFDSRPSPCQRAGGIPWETRLVFQDDGEQIPRILHRPRTRQGAFHPV